MDQAAFAKQEALNEYFREDAEKSKNLLQRQLTVIAAAHQQLAADDFAQIAELDMDALFANARLAKINRQLGDLDGADAATVEAIRLLALQGGAGEILAETIKRYPSMLAHWLESRDVVIKGEAIANGSATSSADTDNRDHFEKLPWPPTAEQRREIGEEIGTVLQRSEIPEAKELLQHLPPLNENRFVELNLDSRVYFGEWRLADDGIALRTARIRSELVRHRYEIRFTRQDGRFIGSELGVIPVHGLPKIRFSENNN